MNALVRKEVRLLLPSFVIGLLLAFSIWLIPGEPGLSPGLRTGLVSLAFMLSPVLLVMLALGSFGRELSAGTFSFLLAQPVSRSRVWWTKTLLLAVAVGLIWLAWWLSLSNNKSFLTGPREERNEVLLTSVLFVIAAYSGGLWTTLLFRQVAAAFWFTLLTPAAVTMAIVAVLPKHPDAVDPALKPALVIALSIYGVAGFLLARWLFLRAQDTHWTGGEIALPKVRGITSWFVGREARRRRRPLAALWKKEFQLHQSQFVLAAVLAVAHLVVLAARKWGGDFKDSPALGFLLEQFWVLWLAMPLLVGCTAVADERKLGTLEGQLCLPSRRRTQFGIKLASALLLSVLMGVVLPLMFEGTRMFPDGAPHSGNDSSHYAITTPGGTIVPIGGFVAAFQKIVPYLSLAGIAVMVAAVSFYASSLARNTMQALGPALLGISLTWTLLSVASGIPEIIHFPLWRGGLVYFIGLPVMAVVLGGLTYWNFKHVLVSGNVWRRNALVLLSALAAVSTVTSATYHRVWEHFMTLEPAHGPARLNHPVAMKSGSLDIGIQLPDGRNWSSRLTESASDWAALLTGHRNVMEAPGSAGYLDGTNWASVGRSYRDVIGIQKDGSLWVSDRLEKPMGIGVPPAPPSPPMVRFGRDSDWKAVVANGSTAYLLKTNGTLWRLGTNRVTWKNWPGFRALVPERLGADSDWANVFFLDQVRLAFQKADGRTWILTPPAQLDPDDEQIAFDADLHLTRAPYLDRQRAVAKVWTLAAPRRNLQLGIGEDGALRVIGHWGWTNATNGRLGKWRLIPESIQLGRETNWVALADDNYDVVALKNDGSLWKLIFATDPITKPDGFSATLLSRHSDWVALTATWDRVLVLAADGSLWHWTMDGQNRHGSGFTLQPLLGASRRPQLIGSLF